MLRLGWTYNILHDDPEAERWFNLARQSPDPDQAKRGRPGFQQPGNCAPSAFEPRSGCSRFSRRAGTTCSVTARRRPRCRLGNLPVSAYLSTRFDGDARVTTGPVAGGMTAAAVFIGGFVHPGLRAGQPSMARSDRLGRGRAKPLSISTSSHEAHDSRLPRRRVLCARVSGTACRRPRAPSPKPTTTASSSAASTTTCCCTRRTAPATHSRSTWASAAVLLERQRDRRYATGQYWANYVETGPGCGFKFRRAATPAVFGERAARSLSDQRGQSAAAELFDLRVGFWYAFTH